MHKSLLLITLICLIFTASIYSQNCITINLQPEREHLTLDNDDIVLTVDASSVENLTYQWQIFDITINDWANITDINDNYSGTNTNTLTITNVIQSINGTLFRVLIFGQSNTCFIESDESLLTYAVIRVNNLFTPNGDGINELFHISGLSRFPNNKLKIYNRWGNLVHEKTNYQSDWDGVTTTGFSVNGSKAVPPGTYFYTIDLKFDNKKLSGWLYINR